MHLSPVDLSPSYKPDPRPMSLPACSQHSNVGEADKAYVNKLVAWLVSGRDERQEGRRLDNGSVVGVGNHAGMVQKAYLKEGYLRGKTKDEEGPALLTMGVHSGQRGHRKCPELAADRVVSRDQEKVEAVGTW